MTADALAHSPASAPTVENRDPDQIEDVFERINRHRNVIDKAKANDTLPKLLGTILGDLLEAVIALDETDRKIIRVLSGHGKSDGAALEAVKMLRADHDRLNKKVSLLLASQGDK